MRYRGFGLTDVGRVRTNNEDAYLVDGELGLFVVSDGMGGHAAGEVASRLAVDGVASRVSAARTTIRSVAAGEGDHRDLRDLLSAAVKSASHDVWKQASSSSKLAGMGCTLTALLVAGTSGAMAHVGDSRLYLCRDGVTEQLSTDHTAADELVRRGMLTRAEAKESPYSHSLTRSIGGQRHVEPDSLMLDVLPDDTFLLCSDGLSEYIEGLVELTARLRRRDPSGVPEELVALANAGGGHDNITSVVVRAVAPELEREAMARLSTRVRAALAALQRVEIFRNLRFVDLLRLHDLGLSEEFETGGCALSTKQITPGLLVVVTGRFEVVVEGETKAFLSPGDAVGSVSLVRERESRGSLIATEPSELLTIGRKEFSSLARRRPWLGVTLWRGLAATLIRERGGSSDDRSL